MAGDLKTEMVALHIRQLIVNDPSPLLQLEWLTADANWLRVQSGGDTFKITVEKERG